MILGALAIADEEQELAGEIVSSALQSIPHGIRVYKSSGGYPERPGYWQYEVLSNKPQTKEERQNEGTQQTPVGYSVATSFISS
jgi:hypothetical protein